MSHTRRITREERKEELPALSTRSRLSSAQKARAFTRTGIESLRQPGQTGAPALEDQATSQIPELRKPKTPTPPKVSRVPTAPLVGGATKEEIRKMDALIKRIKESKGTAGEQRFRDALSNLRKGINERGKAEIRRRGQDATIPVQIDPADSFARRGTPESTQQKIISDAGTEPTPADFTTEEGGFDELGFFKALSNFRQRFIKAQQDAGDVAASAAQSTATAAATERGVTPPTSIVPPEFDVIPPEAELEAEVEEIEKRQEEETKLSERKLEEQLERVRFEQADQIARETERVRRQGQTAAAIRGNVGGFGFIGNTELVAGIENEGAKFLTDLEERNELSLRDLITRGDELRLQLKREQRTELDNFITTRREEVRQRNKDQFERFIQTESLARQQRLDALAVQNTAFNQELAARAEERAQTTFVSNLYQQQLANDAAAKNVPFQLFQQAMDTTGINEPIAAFLTDEFAKVGIDVPTSLLTASTVDSFESALGVAADILPILKQNPALASTLLSFKARQSGEIEKALFTEMEQAIRSSGAFASGNSSTGGITGTPPSVGATFPQSKTGITVNNDGSISFGAPQSRISGGIDLGKQCSGYVNDTLGTPGQYGNSPESKMRNVVSQTPIIGGTFVMSNEGKYGHVGLVQNVTSEGIIISDANNDGKSIGTTRQNHLIRFDSPEFQKISGYGAGAEPVGEVGGEFDDVIFEFENSTPTRKTELLEEARRAGKISQFRKAIELSGDVSRVDDFKLTSVRLALPTKLADSDIDAERIANIVQQFPNLNSKDIAVRFAVGEDFDQLPKDVQNIANFIVKVGGGNLSSQQMQSIIQNTRSGNFVSAINQTEEQILKSVTGQDSPPAQIETNLRNINSAIRLLESNPEFVGKAQGLIRKAAKAIGFSNAEAQDAATILTFINAPTRNKLAGVAVTETEERAIEDILPQLTDPEINALEKLNTMSALLLRTYNAERNAAGLLNVTQNMIFDPLLKVKQYTSGATLQSQLEERQTRGFAEAGASAGLVRGVSQDLFIQREIDNALAQGESADVLRQELREDGFDPSNFTF